MLLYRFTDVKYKNWNRYKLEPSLKLIVPILMKQNNLKEFNTQASIGCHLAVNIIVGFISKSILQLLLYQTV